MIALVARQGSAPGCSQGTLAWSLDVALPREALSVSSGDPVRAALVAFGSSAF